MKPRELANLGVPRCEAMKVAGAACAAAAEAGLDEVPMAYKDIETVTAAQADLVKPIARFDPRPAEERMEPHRGTDRGGAVALT